MTDLPSSEDLAMLRALVPLHTLPDEALADLLSETEIEQFKKGEKLFEEGDTDNQNVYLLEGAVSLLSGRRIEDRVQAGTETARFPLAHQLPRKLSARTESKARVVRIDSRRLSDLLARTQTVDYQVAEYDVAAEDDWMSMLLQSSVLQQVPAANIQGVMVNVERVDVGSGEHLVRQGDPGDYYYMLTRGRAVVKRDADDGRGEVELATLGPGDAFGEEALLSDSPRNSTITMLQDGEVLRLAKEHFVELIHNPLLDRLTMREAQQRIADGAVWVDVRSREQYDQSHLPGALNFPFESLRYQAASLAPDQQYVLYSNTGTRSMAGAFLLTERGLNVSVLEGGVSDAPRDQASDVEMLADAGVPAGPDPEVQQRVKEAETRARDLEARLKLIERDKQSVEAERDQHIEQVHQAVDDAKQKALESEEMKRRAEADREQAYAEMERLTNSLEQVESERASLADRMSEIEGLDKQLQVRLQKAERELIGEREQAESARSSLEELSDKLSGFIEEREEEREHFARERGLLKEEMTALQMELDQAVLDLEEARESVAAAGAAKEQAEQSAVEDLERRLAEAEAAQTALGSERDELRNQLEERSAQLAQAESQVAEIESLRTRLEESDTTGTTLGEARDALQQELVALQTAHEELQSESDAQHARLQAELEEARAKIEADADVLAEADRGQAEGRQQRDELNGQLADLRRDHEMLQAQLASGNQEAGEAIAQAQSRTAELEQQLLEQRQALDDARAESDAEMAALRQAKSESDADNQALREQLNAAEQQQAEAQQAMTALEGDFAQARQDSEQRAAEGEAERAAQLAELQASLEQAQADLAASAAENQELQQRITDTEARFDADLQAERETGSSRESEHAQQQEALAAQLNELQQALDDAQTNNAELQQQLQELQGVQTGDAEQLGSLQQRLEERELALQAARDEQAELIAALDAASAERDNLQLALSDNADEQARLVDLENQVAEALRVHETEMHAHEQELHGLRETLDAESARRNALQEEVDRLNEVIDEDDHSAEQLQAVSAERDALRDELETREREVAQLREVIEEYVGQIQNGAVGGEDLAQVAALQEELNMVREQAIRDVAHMREQLAAAETQSRRLHQADDREAISHEAMRQQIEGLESSLAERQRDLAEAEDSRHMLEDEIEDLNRQMDELRLDVERMQGEAEHADVSRREAEKARDQLQEALQQIQAEGVAVPLDDLRDERLQGSQKPVGMDSVGKKSPLLPLIVGMGLGLGALEALSFLSGQGELIGTLLKMAGQ